MSAKTRSRKGASTSAARSARVNTAAAAEACADTCCAESCSEEPARATEPQHGSIVHVEFTTPDLAKGARLYGKLFGWQFQPFMKEEMYFGTPGNWGPCGCMLQGAPTSKAPTVLYVNVDDINATLVKAKGLGATVKRPKTEIPGGNGFFAEVKMPDGNTFGIYNRG